MFRKSLDTEKVVQSPQIVNFWAIFWVIVRITASNLKELNLCNNLKSVKTSSFNMNSKSNHIHKNSSHSKMGFQIVFFFMRG